MTKELKVRRTDRGLGAAVVTAVLLLAGCGADGTARPAATTASPPTTAAPAGPADNGLARRPAREILAAAERAFRSARSVRAKLDFKDRDGLFRMDLKLTSSRDAAGWMEKEGVRVDLIAARGKVYLRGRKLWEQQGNAEVARLIGDRWVRIPTAVVGELTPFTKDMTIAGLADMIFDQETPRFTRKSRATVGGRPAVRLQALDGSFFIAATGKPYPLLLDGVGDNLDMAFSRYDQHLVISAPRGALDLERLRG
jgi:hypothetical protein